MAAAEVIDSAERAGFDLRDVEALREHYTMTLRHWLRRLETNEEKAIDIVGEKRYRTWRLYLLGAISGFRRGTTSIVQMILSKPDATGMSGMPLTRSYML
jgi:cyclopropane-fatty-acyl-phospholipid synthase